MAGTSYKEHDTLGEPSLDELFAEPIVQLFMARDGLSARDVLGQLNRVLQLFPAAAI